MGARSLASKLALAHELRRILRILYGDDWEEIFADIIADHPGIPTSLELDYFDHYGYDPRQISLLKSQEPEDDGAPFPEERF